MRRPSAVVSTSGTPPSASSSFAASSAASSSSSAARLEQAGAKMEQAATGVFAYKVIRIFFKCSHLDHKVMNNDVMKIAIYIKT